MYLYVPLCPPCTPYVPYVLLCLSMSLYVPLCTPYVLLCSPMYPYVPLTSMSPIILFSLPWSTILTRTLVLMSRYLHLSIHYDQWWIRGYSLLIFTIYSLTRPYMVKIDSEIICAPPPGSTTDDLHYTFITTIITSSLCVKHKSHTPWWTAFFHHLYLLSLHLNTLIPHLHYTLIPPPLHLNTLIHTCTTP